MVGADRLEVGINRHAHVGRRLRGILLRGLASQMGGRPKLQLALKRMVLVVKHEDALAKSARTGEGGTFLLGLM